MSEEDPKSNGQNDFVKRSGLYQEFLAEREEILRYKWLESERLQRYRIRKALLDWIRKHRDGWRSARQHTFWQCEHTQKARPLNKPF